MPEITLDHFKRAAADIGAHGDNDTLPFDIDTQFVTQKQVELAGIAYSFYSELCGDTEKNNSKKIAALNVFSERLLAPTGASGFRVTTKIHPFWNIYLNGLGVGIANALEEKRDSRVRSYRFLRDGGSELFDRTASWKAFREATAGAAINAVATVQSTVVLQTDISSFYEQISHHHVENFIDDLFPDGRVGNQVNALLGKFSGGRSFGLPVGSQCSRIIAELFLDLIDRRLSTDGINWYRYVDDYVVIAVSQAEAYRALSALSHTLADYGLALNKTKTVMLSAKHYSDYVNTQIGSDDEAGKLREIDLVFDPYSDSPREDFESLKQTVESLQVQKLLNRELEKAVPDNFLVTQIERTLSLHEPAVAAQLATTLLGAGNLHSLRASWSTLMRGIAKLRSTQDFSEIFATLDQLLDLIPEHSAHLLQAEGGLLHYLRTLRFAQTPRRTTFVQRVYDAARSDTVKRACIDCWRHWKDRSAFTFLRNRWNELSPECQRLVWLAAYAFGDQGEGFRRQVGLSLANAWKLGIERQNVATYALIYKEWCDAPQPAV